MCCRIRRWKDGLFTLQLCKTKQQFSGRFRRRGPERGREAQWKERKIAVNIVSQFISSVAAVRAGDSFADKVDEATIMLLMSTKLEVRKAAYSVQLTYHVEKKSRKINEQLRLAIRSICRSKVEGWYDNASWNVPSNNWRWSIAQVLHQDCRSSFDRLLLRIHDRKGKTEAVVSATCNITSSISFIPCPALCQPASKQETLRKVPVFLAPILSRFINQIYPYSAKIAEILTNSMNVCTNSVPEIVK